jgi:hypothetical protein
MLHVIPDIVSGSPKNAEPADPFRRAFLAYGLNEGRRKSLRGSMSSSRLVIGAELLIIELFIYL